MFGLSAKLRWPDGHFVGREVCGGSWEGIHRVCGLGHRPRAEATGSVRTGNDIVKSVGTRLYRNPEFLEFITNISWQVSGERSKYWPYFSLPYRKYRAFVWSLTEHQSVV